MSRAEKARELFLKGYNCSQAVFAAFADIMKIDEETALRLSSSFGGGMGRMREVCGACSGMFMAAGMLYGYTDPSDDTAKAEHYALIQRMAKEFRYAKNNGSIICKELLALQSKADFSPAPTARTDEFYKARPCLKYVEDAAEILESILNEKNAKI